MGFEPTTLPGSRPRTAPAAPKPAALRIVVGQRYISDAEPELGLGVVVSADERLVHLAFAAADETRSYVHKSAPLRRVRFATGDTLTDDAGRTHSVTAVEDRDGVLYYQTDHGELAEARV